MLVTECVITPTSQAEVGILIWKDEQHPGGPGTWSSSLLLEGLCRCGLGPSCPDNSSQPSFPGWE